MKRLVSALLVLVIALSAFSMVSCNMAEEVLTEEAVSEADGATEQETQGETGNVNVPNSELDADPEPDPKPEPDPDPFPNPDLDPKPEPDPVPNPEPDPVPNPEPDPNPSEYVYSYSYINDTTFAKIKSIYENEKPSVNAYSFGVSPFVLADLFEMSGAQITSISIPVWGTYNADGDGNYVFTLSIFKNDLTSLAASSAVHTYPIKISGTKYGLTDRMSALYRIIDVDLTEYGIELENDEALAVGDKNDSLVPAYLGSDFSNTHPIYNILKKEAPQMLSFSGQCGKERFVHQTNSVFFNFTLKRTYTDKASYEAAVNGDADLAKMIAALKKKHGGLNLSVFGDSISTYMGISNNTEYNSTIGNNALWYDQNNINRALLFDHTYTYWGSMLRELQMELCVNNAWSGDSLKSGQYKTRAQQLHNNEGEDPDLILVYFGVNDCGNTAPGGLIDLLANRGDRSEHEVMDEWYRRVIAKDGNCSTFDEMYATMLHLMMEKYPDADVVCVGLTYSTAKDNTNIPFYNQAIKAIADYLDIPFVNQQNVISKDNYHAYMHDSDANYFLHPNACGHRLIFEEIIRTIYSELQSENGKNA